MSEESKTQETTEEVKVEAVVEEVATEETTEIVETPEEAPKEVKAEKVVEEKAAEVVVEEAPAEVVEEAKVEKKAKKAAKPKKEIEVEIAGEFDWDAFETKGFGEGYSKKEKEDLSKIYEETLTTVEEKKVVKGAVVSINDRDVVLNIGFKSDGLVGASEFRDTPDLKVGDEVEVYIEEQENSQGQLVLSRRKAKIVRAWEIVQDALDNDNILEGIVKRRTKGGLIVDIYGIESFLPGSQIDVKPIRDFDVFVGKKMEVKVVKINHANDNVVVSHKVLIEKDLEKQKALILKNLEKGQVLEGVIKNMTNFGVFIDLGGVDGLLHITDISWGRINDPADVLTLDEKVNVVVLDFDDDKKRISLGMKQLTEHPWDKLEATVEIGSKVKGKIVNVADYGAFLELLPGVEGLIHVSEMSWSQHLRNPQDFMKVGDEMEAVVLTLDREERKMSLGIKQMSEDPWTKTDLLTKYGVGTNHSGIVRNLTNFGLFIELEEGIDGLVHVSDLSWTKKIKHPSEFVKVNEELEVQVLELDIDNRRLALGHKQLEENPWDTFETVFSKGSVHKCAVISRNDKGATLELPYGLEGISTNRHMKKEDGSNVEVGETVDFIVIDFSKDDKRIVLSHTNTHSKTEEKPAAPKKKATGGRGSGVSKVNKETEVSTLGDLDALSALKAEMEGNTKKANEKKAKTKKAEPKAAVVEEVAETVEEAPAEAAVEEKPKAKKAPAKKAPAKKKAAPKAAKEEKSDDAPAEEAK
jgi:small subunit ribosomal protein S1